jgi:rhomboid protease GluP
MVTDSTRPAPDYTFDVDFNGGPAHARNRDLGGKGQLIVRAEEPRFVFRGKARRLFSAGTPEREIALRSDEIANVIAEGAVVQFTTPHGQSGATKTPFSFSCASADYANAIMDLLPATKDTDFVESENFVARIRQLPGGGPLSITNLLLLLNGVVFVVMGFLGAGWVEVASMEPYIRFGANNAAATTDGEWWRLVTCMFLHYGLVHLLLNAWALFQSGQLVERLFGRRLYLLVYFGSGLSGSIATLLWKGDRAWSAGASGAVFGVFGALLGYLLREKQGIPKGIFQPIFKSTLAFAGYNLVFGAIHPNIDNAAHLGGLAGGFVLGWLCALPPDVAVRARLAGPRAWTALAVIAVVVGAGVMLAPRYDYRVGEDRALKALLREEQIREQQIIPEVFAATHSLLAQRGVAEFARRMREEGIPFYEDWRARLDRLPLTPGRRTARQREQWRRVVDLKLETYRHYATALEAGSPTAAHDYDLARARIAEEEVRAVTEK